MVIIKSGIISKAFPDYHALSDEDGSPGIIRKGPAGEKGGVLRILAWIFHDHDAVKRSDVCRRQDGAISQNRGMR